MPTYILLCVFSALIVTHKLYSVLPKTMSRENTSLEKLQKFLNQCIELWRKPRGHSTVNELIWWVEEIREHNYGTGNYSKSIDISFWRTVLTAQWHRDERRSKDFKMWRDVHQLFSKEGRLMEFVRWKNIYYFDWYGNYPERHYCNMSTLNAQQKIDYFLKNALLPTQDQWQN